MVSANGLDQWLHVVQPAGEPRSDQGVDEGSDRGPTDGLSSGYTIQEAAEALGVHPNTIRRRIRKGKLPATLAEGPGGQEYRISRVALEDLRLELAQAERAAGHRGFTTGHTTPANGVDHGLTGVSPGVAPPGIPRSDPPFNQAVATWSDAGATSQPPGTGRPADEPAGRPPASSAPATESAALQTLARAREMAAYTEQLLDPYVKRIEEQAEEIGRLKERTVHLQGQLDDARAQAAAHERQAEELGQLQAELAQAQQRAGEASAALARREEAATSAGSPRPWWRFW